MNPNQTIRPAQPAWMKTTLLLAAAYNILWGGFVIIWPNFLFNTLSLDLPRYPELWQCIGMIVGVYGIGYAISAFDVRRHWPIVLVGFLGKIFGPIGFAQALWNGTFPAAFGWVILTNDLIWWVPFALMLKYAWQPQTLPVQPLASALWAHRTNEGDTLAELSRQQQLMVVFLRHFGCTFCRETLSDLERDRAKLESDGNKLVLVHMSPTDKADEHLKTYNLQDVAHISDPQRQLYLSFNLRRGSWTQLFGPAVLVRGLQAWRHGVGGLAGDGLQMPGVFILYQERILHSYSHAHAGSRPNYVALGTRRNEDKDCCDWPPEPWSESRASRTSNSRLSF